MKEEDKQYLSQVGMCLADLFYSQKNIKMKQTAVNWMTNELLYLDNEYDMKFIDKNEYQARRKVIINQAKAMEREQIIDACQYFLDVELPNEICEQYYNETFKSE